MRKKNIADALFSKVQQRVLGLLYGNPDKDFHTNEIIRFSDSGTGAVQRELKNLAFSGLVIVKQLGNQKRYQANRDVPFFAEMRGIVIKTFGLADVMRDALKPISDSIQFAFIYGSIAKQEDHAASDIDLMIIGDKLTYAELFHILEKAEKKLNRKINPTFYSMSEWLRKYHDENHFIKKIVEQPKIFLIGNENEFESGQPGKD